MNVFNMRGRSSRVTIDGMDFVGSSISISGDGTVTVDGVAQKNKLVGPVSVTVAGNCDYVETGSGRVEVSGLVGSVKTMSGDVRCGDISGSVSTMSGDITATSIAGGASSMSGDIRGVK
jgi:hypothetical protein